MNINSLPTDSFYKFIALAGTALILVFTYLMSSSLYTETIKLDEFQIKQAIVSAERDVLTDRLAETQEVIESIKKQKNPSKESFREMVEEYKEEKKIHRELKIKQAELKAIVEIRREWFNRHLQMLVFVAIFMILGAIMAVWGFVCWYSRIQVYQDMIIKRTAQGKDSKASDATVSDKVE